MKKIIGVYRNQNMHWVGDGFPVKNLFSYDRLGQAISPFFSVHDKFHRILVLSGFFFLKIASTFLNSSFFPKPIKRRIAI